MTVPTMTTKALRAKVTDHAIFCGHEPVRRPGKFLQKVE